MVLFPRRVMTLATMPMPSRPQRRYIFLDDHFTPLATGEIKVDVRPRFAAAARAGTVFIQESLEEQPGLDGIDGGNFQAITNNRICGAAPGLGKDAVRLAEIDDVPDQQKIAGKPQFDDEI